MIVLGGGAITTLGGRLAFGLTPAIVLHRISLGQPSGILVRRTVASQGPWGMALALSCLLSLGPRIEPVETVQLKVAPWGAPSTRKTTDDPGVLLGQLILGQVGGSPGLCEARVAKPRAPSIAIVIAVGRTAR